MTDDNTPKGPLTRWYFGGYEGWRYQDFATLHDAVTAPTYESGPVVITRPVAFTVTMVVEEGEA